MLSDPKWDEKVEVELDSVSQHILRAADYIIQHGWCQNKLETPDGEVCLQGALMRTDITTERMDCMTIAYHSADNRVRTYLQAISTYIWNDRQGRTKEEVINTLREAAYLGK